MNQEGNQLLRLFSFGPFSFFCIQYTIELVVGVYHSPFDRLLTCDSRSKGYGEHKQQVRWYIEYKKRKETKWKQTQ